MTPSSFKYLSYFPTLARKADYVVYGCPLKSTHPIGGRGGISPICAAAAANKSASVMEPNLVDGFLFDVFSGSG